jgi:hypothetical protein
MIGRALSPKLITRYQPSLKLFFYDNMKFTVNMFINNFRII